MGGVPDVSAGLLHRSQRLARLFARNRRAASRTCHVHTDAHGPQGFASLGLKKGDKGEPIESKLGVVCATYKLISAIPLIVVVAMSGGVDSSVSLALLASPHLPRSISSDLATKLPFAFSKLTLNSSTGQIALDPSKDLDISAVFMRNWSPLLNEIDHPSWETDCAWEKDWQDVQQVCKMFDVPVKLVDLSEAYWMQVFEPAIELWQEGKTPNPDVACNREIKFGQLMDRVLTPGPGSWLATGEHSSSSMSVPFDR